jgi:prophage antirepressor-like protein
MQWLDREHPDLVELYTRMYYGKNSYAPKEYRKWLAAKIKPLIRKHGLALGEEDPVTGGVRSTPMRSRRDTNGELSTMLAEELPPSAAARMMTGPTLF